VSPSWRLEWKTVCTLQEMIENGKIKNGYRTNTQQARHAFDQCLEGHSTHEINLDEQQQKNLSITELTRQRNCSGDYL
jgi:hypothetical protein